MDRYVLKTVTLSFIFMFALTLNPLQVLASHQESEPVCFSIVDLNSDGNISPVEFQDAFSTMGEQDFSEIDLDGDGVLSEDEYLLFIDRNTSR